MQTYSRKDFWISGSRPEKLPDDGVDAAPVVAEAEEVGHPVGDLVNASTSRRQRAGRKSSAPWTERASSKLQGSDDALNVVRELKNQDAIASDR